MSEGTHRGPPTDVRVPRRDDRIIWAPIGKPIATSGVRGLFFHWCPRAVIQHVCYRDQLDPMAVGTCRYCGEQLPVVST